MRPRARNEASMFGSWMRQLRAARKEAAPCPALAPVPTSLPPEVLPLQVAPVRWRLRPSRGVFVRLLLSGTPRRHSPDAGGEVIFSLPLAVARTWSFEDRLQ